MSRPAPVLRVVDLAAPLAPGLQVGEVVRTGANRYPYYEVVAISGERAWVRDVQYGDDYIVSIAVLRKAFS